MAEQTGEGQGKQVRAILRKPEKARLRSFCTGTPYTNASQEYQYRSTTKD